MAVKLEKIVLKGERSQGVDKYINNLSKWKFFQVLYSKSMFRMILTNILMLIFAVPILYFLIANASQISQLGQVLPITSSIGVGYAPWQQLDSYIATQREIINDNFLLWLIPSVAFISFAISGSFAVVRNSYWTGKIRVLKVFFTGIADTFYITLPCMAVVSGLAYGLYYLYQTMLVSMTTWLAIVLLVLILIIFAIFVLYLFVLFAVVSVYKQPFGTSLVTSWNLLMLNKLPNVFFFIIALFPLALVFLASGLFSTLILAFFIMLGAFYIAYVWMCHMMKTFTLFNPVEKRRIK